MTVADGSNGGADFEDGSPVRIDRGVPTPKRSKLPVILMIIALAMIVGTCIRLFNKP